MASQRDIRRRIQSSRNIKQITRAMQFVAASKLKRAQESTLAARPYSDKLDEVLADVATVLGLLCCCFSRGATAGSRTPSNRQRRTNG